MKRMLSRIFGVILVLTFLAGIPIDVNAADSVQLKFTTSPQTITAGALSGMFTIQTTDNQGGSYNATTSTTLSLTSSSPDGKFYSDSTGLIPVTSITLKVGESSVRFYYRDTVSGSPTITVSESPSKDWTPASQVQTVIAAELDHFTFAPIENQNANVPFNVTLTALDIYENTVTSYTEINTLSASAGSISPSTTDAFINGVWTGNVTIDSPQDNITINTFNGEKSGTSNAFIVSVFVEISMSFITTPQTITAGNLSELYTVQTQDDTGNPYNVIEDAIINLTSSSANGIFYSDAEGLVTITQITILANESSVSFYYKDTVSGSPTITVSESPSQGWTPASQIQTVNAAELDHFVFTNIANQNANIPFSLTITARDIYENTVVLYTGTNTLSTSAGTINPVSTGAFTNGVWTGNVTIDSAQSNITINTSGGSKNGASNTFNITASIPVVSIKLVFTTAPQTIDADDASNIITIQTRDNSNNPYNVETDTVINLTSSSATGAFYNDAAGLSPITQVTINSGSNSASFYYKDTAAGSPSITAEVSPSLGWTLAIQQETVNPSVPADNGDSEAGISLTLIIIIAASVVVLAAIGFFVFSRVKKTGNKNAGDTASVPEKTSKVEDQTVETPDIVKQEEPSEKTTEPALTKDTTEQETVEKVSTEPAQVTDAGNQDITSEAVPEPVKLADTTEPAVSPEKTSELTNIVDTTEQKLMADMMTEIETNYRIADAPVTTTLVAFQSKVWDANRNDIDFLPDNAKEELAKAYMAMSLANGVVWLANEQGRRSANLDDNYLKLCKNIIEQLDNVKQILKH
jgi:hypothetical protein